MIELNETQERQLPNKVQLIRLFWKQNKLGEGKENEEK